MFHPRPWAASAVLVLALFTGCGAAQELSAENDPNVGDAGVATMAGDAPRTPGGDAPPASTTPPSSDAGATRRDASVRFSDSGAAARDAAVRRDGGASSDAGAAGIAFQCTRDSDCMLVNDCCTCAAMPKAGRAPACDPRMQCLIPKCSEYGSVEQPRCSAGRCVLGFDCNASNVTCKRSPPICPQGQVPRVVMEGGMRCYGDCVDARQCRSIPNCSSCARGDLCVRYGTTPAPQFHCISTPSLCASALACGCSEAAACTAPYTSCRVGPQPMTLSCETP